MIVEIKIPKEDITEFCDACTNLKSRGIYTEVFQGNKVISGSSLLGITTMLTDDEPVHLMTRQFMEDKDIDLIKKWIVWGSLHK